MDASASHVVTIDGPAASGKSSTAQWVADTLGWQHIDSGSLYRAATWARQRQAGSPEGWTEASVVAAAANVSLRPEARAFYPVAGDLPIGDAIRSVEVTADVSRVARMPGVRAWVNERVREAARGRDVVVDGRDMGTVVFPGAPLKIWLVADPWERARRRLTQRLERRPSDEEIAAETDEIVQRDARDATQTVQAKDAVLVDTTYLTQPEQVERIVALARAVVQKR
ncbi:MAG: (d)CMP kinase [Gemmatimonadetes bacterium]|nr:(d)CMP kinase [Gemmatimonadota bacterium]